MSALSDYILSRNGLLHYWQVTDRSGTTLPDSIPTVGNRLPMTVTNPVDGPAITADGGLSLRGDGTSTRAITANLATGAADRFAANANYTIGAFTVLRAAPPANRVLFGRTPQYMRVTSGRNVTFMGSGTQIQSRVPLPIGELCLVLLTWNGRKARMTINGVLVAAQITAGVISDTADPWELLSLGGGAGNAVQADVAHAFVFNRVLGQGEADTIYRLGASSPVTKNSLLVDQANYAPALASAAADNCFTCSGNMRVAEARVGTERHPACYGASAGFVTAPVLTVSSAAGDASAFQIVGSAKQQLEEQLKYRIFRATNEQSLYHNGTTWTGLPTPGTEMNEIMGGGAGAAGLFHAAGSSDRSWLAEYAKAVVEQAITAQAANPVPSRPGVYADGPSWGLGVAYVLETYLWLKPYLDTATRNRWLASFNLAANDWFSNERNYYVNGNVEVGETLAVYLMYLVTGDSVWQSRYQTQIATTIAPSTSIGALGNNANAAGFGWKWVVEPTGGSSVGGNGLAGTGDGANGKGYFAESKNDTTHPEQIGYDVIYTTVQLEFMIRLYEWSGDARLVKYINSMLNLLLDSVNTTTANQTIVGPAGDSAVIAPWAIDGRIGVRTPTFIRPFNVNAIFWLSQHPSLRSVNTLPAEWPVRQWSAVATDMINNRATYGTYLRGLGETLVPWIRSGSAWWPALRS